MPHWLDKVIVLLSADTADLRELALIAGGDPRTFYHGVDPGRLELEEQDLRGIEFKRITREHVKDIHNSKSKEERLALLLDSILHNRSEGLRIIEAYADDNSIYANKSLDELKKALIAESETGKADNLALVRAVRRPLAHQLGDSRANLIYYFVKHLSKYPDIKAYLVKSYANTSSEDIDRYRSEIERHLAYDHPLESPTGATRVAAWMAEELKKQLHLYQEQTAKDIQRLFGKSFVYNNANGNPAISKSVLKEFNKLTKEDVVWSRGERYWRARIPTDKPGRQQD